MECRIRKAMFATDAVAAEGGLKPLDLTEALPALGNVFAELLAHYDDIEAKRWLGELASARERWKREPRVMLQNTVGNA